MTVSQTSTVPALQELRLEHFEEIIQKLRGISLKRALYFGRKSKRASANLLTKHTSLAAPSLRTPSCFSVPLPRPRPRQDSPGPRGTTRSSSSGLFWAAFIPAHGPPFGIILPASQPPALPPRIRTRTEGRDSGYDGRAPLIYSQETLGMDLAQTLTCSKNQRGHFVR